MNALKENSLARSQPLAGHQTNPQTTKPNPQRQLWEECENTPTRALNNALAHIGALLSVLQTV